jgi:hypothetical protein
MFWILPKNNAENVATSYGLDRPRFESRQGHEIFCLQNCPVRFRDLPICFFTWVPEFFPGRKNYILLWIMQQKCQINNARVHCGSMLMWTPRYTLSLPKKMCDSTHQLNSWDELVDGVRVFNLRWGYINFWCNVHRHDCMRLLLLNSKKTKHCVRVTGVLQRVEFITSISLQTCDMAARRTQTMGYLLATNEVSTKYVPLSRSSYSARM